MTGSHALPALSGACRGGCEVNGGVGTSRAAASKEQDVDNGVSDPEQQAEADDSCGDGKEERDAGPVHVSRAQADRRGIRLDLVLGIPKVHEHVGRRRVHVQGRIDRVELVDKVRRDGSRPEGQQVAAFRFGVGALDERDVCEPSRAYVNEGGENRSIARLTAD